MKLKEVDNAQVSGGPRVGQGVFGILGRRWGTPGWANDPVRRQGGRQCMGFGTGVGFPLGQTSDVRRRGRGGFKFKLHNNK